jgi:hypothetical protein
MPSVGLVNKVVSHELLDEEVLKFATKLTRGPIAARGWTKSLVSSANGDLVRVIVYFISYLIIYFFKIQLLALENEIKLQTSAANTKEFLDGIKRFSKAKL